MTYSPTARTINYHRLTPSTLQDIEPDKTMAHAFSSPMISVYTNCIRFNKLAASIMNLPKRIAILVSKDKLFIEPDENGFDVIVSGSWSDFVINKRSLSKVILQNFGGATKVIFEVVNHGNLYELKRVN